MFTPPQLSEAVTVKLTTAESAPGAAITVISAGVVIVGATVSLTVIDTVPSELVNGPDMPSPVSVTVNLRLSLPQKFVPGV